jgi:hypothetical protein
LPFHSDQGRRQRDRSVYTAGTADLDRGGHLDLVAAMSPLSTREPGKVVVLKGNGAGASVADAVMSLALDNNPGLAHSPM